MFGPLSNTEGTKQLGPLSSTEGTIWLVPSMVLRGPNKWGDLTAVWFNLSKFMRFLGDQTDPKSAVGGPKRILRTGGALTVIQSPIDHCLTVRLPDCQIARRSDHCHWSVQDDPVI